MKDRQISEQQMRMQFAQNLKYLRKSKKHYISQDSFARLMNLPLKTIGITNQADLPLWLMTFTVSATIMAVPWRSC